MVDYDGYLAAGGYPQPGCRALVIGFEICAIGAVVNSGGAARSVHPDGGAPWRCRDEAPVTGSADGPDDGRRLLKGPDGDHQQSEKR